MAAPVDPTRTAAPDVVSQAETRTGNSDPANGTPTGTYQAPSAIYHDFIPHARGGIGEVFRATDAALNRTVAVKRLQNQRASNPESRRRFLVEAEITARLEHPGVVPVYTLFTDEGGGPAYAMRFVQGPTLWDAIGDYHVSPPDPVAFRRLLQSFLQVCQTVAYAHTRGVIHRDLKPQNILLGKFGETLVVDWGLAKVVGRAEDNTTNAPSEGTLVPTAGTSGSETAMGSVVGTPAFMSPEQAGGRWDVVAQTSDIYSLGAVLYTVLTGRPPLETGNWPELQQRIQQGDFPQPRHVKADTPHSLEAVCLKAMALAPESRYPSAEALAADIEHWMADEPVAAQRDGFSTRVRRWAKRNRMVVSGASVLLIAAVVGLSIGTVLLGTKNREVQHQRQVAETAKRKAEVLNRFLIDDLLKQADPVNNPLGAKITVRVLLDKSALRLETQTDLRDLPEVEAELRSVIGHAYEYLSVFDKAERHDRRAWDLLTILRGPYDVETLSIRNRHAFVVASQDNRPDAESLARSALADCELVLGPTHSETGDAANNLAEVCLNKNKTAEGVALRRRASQILNGALGDSHNKTLEIDNNFGVALVRAGQPDEGLAILRSVIERRRVASPGHFELGRNLGNLGGALVSTGRFDQAEVALREASAISATNEDTQGTLSARNLLAYSVECQGRYLEAQTGYLAVLAERRGLPDQQSSIPRSLAWLARLYAKQERWDDASLYLAKLILLRQPDSTRNLDGLTDELTAALTGQMEAKAAESLLRDCVEVVNTPLWVGDWLKAELASRHGDCLRRQGKFEKAKPILESAAGDVAKAVGVPAWGVAASRKRVADLFTEMGDLSEAAKWK